MSVSVTLLYGGLTGLLITLLGLNVSLNRLRLKVGGVQPVPHELLRPIRAHGNAAEWAPLGLALLLVLELSGRVNGLWLHVAGGSLLLGRVLHVLGMLGRVRGASTAAATVTYVLMGGLSVGAVWAHFGG